MSWLVEIQGIVATGVLPAILQDGLLLEENIGNCMMIVQEIAR